MTRVFASALAVGTIVLGSAAAATGLPHLNSATSHKRHVVVTFTLGELAPGRIVVAVRRETTPRGKFVAANVRLDEQLRAVNTATGYRARTTHALRPGRYYVQVSGVVVALDCTPLRPCRQDWSNVRRVVVRGS